jgi:hypothetical protein
MSDIIDAYPAHHLKFTENLTFSQQVTECYASDGVQNALHWSVFSVSKFCGFVMQRRVTNTVMKEEFRRLREEPVWRAENTHSVEAFTNWVSDYVMHGANENIVVSDLYALKMKTGESVQEFAKRIEVQAGMAFAVTKGDYYTSLPWILVQGLLESVNGWNLQSLVTTKLNEKKVAYFQTQISKKNRVQHWGEVRALAIGVAKNLPVAAIPAPYRNSGMRRPAQPYTSARRAGELDQAVQAAAMNPVGAIGSSRPAVRRIPFRSNRSKSPFRSNTQRGCFNCGKEGHLQAECREPLKPKECYNCGKEGHFARNCLSAPADPTQALGRLPARQGETAGAFIRRMTIEPEEEEFRRSQEGDSNEDEAEEKAMSGEDTEGERN